MNLLIKSIVALAASLSFCYGLGVFVSLEPNVLLWHEVSRALLWVEVPLIALLFGLALSALELSNNGH